MTGKTYTLLLRMTDTMSTWNIDLSSGGTLYVKGLKYLSHKPFINIDTNIMLKFNAIRHAWYKFLNYDMLCHAPCCWLIFVLYMSLMLSPAIPFFSTSEALNYAVKSQMFLHHCRTITETYHINGLRPASHVTLDAQSVRPSWCRGSPGAHAQVLL
jgi:hypothetical protein